jgi:CubicO group peptidase (beta-lactamase class C family)
MTIPRVAGLALSVTVFAAPVPRGAVAQRLDAKLIAAKVDSIAMAPITEGRVAGMSVAVVRGADTVVLAGYGSADLELRVPTPPNAVYEIGSVTKQFTAAAVLQLRDRGLIDLDADLTDYLEDYPTQGHRIPVRRLLNHTSGIKGYTEISSFDAIMSRRLARDSLVHLFASEPFDFTPGDAMIYNNSAYFLLGLIIEKVSGVTYEDYVKQHLFEPAGMTHSQYCSHRTLIPNRASGYDMGGDGLERARYIDHTWPYAAGSLCSTAGDLVAWDRALHGHGNGGDILSPAAYRDLLTPGVLNDGTVLRYAKGLAVTDTGGRRMISHGGGIFGFLSESRYYPDADLIIVVLINTAGPVSPVAIADQIADLMLAPVHEADDQTYPGSVESLVGSYRGQARGAVVTAVVERDSLGLTLQLGNNRQVLHYRGGGSWAGNGANRYTFVQREATVSELHADLVSGYYVLMRVTR